MPPVLLETNNNGAGKKQQNEQSTKNEVVGTGKQGKRKEAVNNQ